jgi:flagellar motor component MotA
MSSVNRLERTHPRRRSHIFADDASTMTRTNNTSDLMNSVNDLSDVIFESFRKDTAQKKKSDFCKMLADLRAESRRSELLDVEGASKKQKLEA